MEPKQIHQAVVEADFLLKSVSKRCVAFRLASQFESLYGHRRAEPLALKHFAKAAFTNVAKQVYFAIRYSRAASQPLPLLRSFVFCARRSYSTGW
jgi:hypothetical protein